MRGLSEPIFVIVAGGTTLVQAVIHLVAAFGHPITPAQEVAITEVTTIVFAVLARTQVVPTNALPPGTVGQMADAKAAKAAEKAGV